MQNRPTSSSTRKGRHRGLLWLGALVAATLIGGIWLDFPAQSETSSVGAPSVQLGRSGLPLPRFVSLKSDRVNVRGGPGQDHHVSWTFSRAGLPVEITAEYENWRRIRDSDGAEGWVFHSLLSGRRTGVVAPWSKDEALPLKQNDSDGAATVALIEPRVLVDVQECGGTWCRVSVKGVTGWLRQEALWGVYPQEIVR